jgi:CHAD domain-containing protein
MAHTVPIKSLHDAGLNLLDGAIETLTSSQDDEAVHAVRKTTKRLRALLRLMQRCMGPLAYRRENGRVRDAAKPLTAVRDAFISRKSLRGMPKCPLALRRGLDAEYHRERNALETQGARTAIAQFLAIRERLAELPASNSEVASAIAGVRKSYKAGRSARAQAKPRDDQALHEWRKQAKYLLNQLELLRVVFNVEFKKLHRRADRLADILGTDHDLGVLLSKLRFYDANNRSLVKHLKKRRHRLQAQAFRLGKKLYRRPPKRFATALRASLGGAQRPNARTGAARVSSTNSRSVVRDHH